MRGKRRGFAVMAPEAVREIARAGGRAAHVAGTAHEWTIEEAREAGRKGGQAAHARRREAEAQTQAERLAEYDRAQAAKEDVRSPVPPPMTKQ